MQFDMKHEFACRVDQRFFLFILKCCKKIEINELDVSIQWSKKMNSPEWKKELKKMENCIIAVDYASVF